jgi:mRNA interferase MazF
MKHTVRQGDIYLADLSGYVGSEQSGLRPAVVVQNDVGNRYSPTTIVVPLTSKQKPSLPTHTVLNPDDCGVKQESIALCEQLRVIDKSRLKKKLGKIENINKLQELNRSLMSILGVVG